MFELEDDIGKHSGEEGVCCVNSYQHLNVQHSRKKLLMMKIILNEFEYAFVTGASYLTVCIQDER